MKTISLLIIGAVFFVASYAYSDVSNKCKCKNCSCVQESNCGCLSGKECTCDSQMSCCSGCAAGKSCNCHQDMQIK